MSTSSSHLDPPGDDVARLLLRLAAGGLLLPHGLGKLLGWFGGPGLVGFAHELQGFGLPASAPLPLLLALVQTLAGLFMALGLFTRISAVFAGGFLATTVVLNLAHGWFWMHGGIEYPLLWAVTAFCVCLLGAGQYSLDAQRVRRRRGSVTALPAPRPAATARVFSQKGSQTPRNYPWPT